MDDKPRSTLRAGDLTQIRAIASPQGVTGATDDKTARTIDDVLSGLGYICRDSELTVCGLYVPENGTDSIRILERPESARESLLNKISVKYRAAIKNATQAEEAFRARIPFSYWANEIPYESTAIQTRIPIKDDALVLRKISVGIDYSTLSVTVDFYATNQTYVMRAFTPSRKPVSIQDNDVAKQIDSYLASMGWKNLRT